MATELDYLRRAVDLARISFDEGGFPVGALIVQNGQVVAEGLSQGNLHDDPTHHAETSAIRSACASLKTRNLKDATLYSSLEPCIMCFSSCFWARIPRIVYACRKEFAHYQYYEGTVSLETLNKGWRSAKELILLTDFEANVAEMIREWEARIIK